MHNAKTLKNCKINFANSDSNPTSKPKVNWMTKTKSIHKKIFFIIIIKVLKYTSQPKQNSYLYLQNFNYFIGLVLGCGGGHVRCQDFHRSDLKKETEERDLCYSQAKQVNSWIVIKDQIGRDSQSFLSQLRKIFVT